MHCEGASATVLTGANLSDLYDIPVTVVERGGRRLVDHHGAPENP